MLIQRVEASYHDVKVAVPLLDRPEERDTVFVRVETDDGAKGYGLAGSILGTLAVEFIVPRVPGPPGLTPQHSEVSS